MAAGQGYWDRVQRECKPLTRPEEDRLDERLRRVRDQLALDPDDPAAERERLALRDRYVCGTIRYAIKVASRQRRATPLDDAVQEASIGLMRAFDKYDPDRGVRFLTYATWWVRAQLDAYTSRDATLLRVPRQCGQIMREVSKRGAQSRREADVARALRAPVWLDDAPVPPEETTSSPDYVERLVDAHMTRERVEARLRSLPERTRDILRRRYGFDTGDEETLQSIADSYGLSRERVRQLAKAAAAYLRAGMAS
jgi:RNA polymerase sigma factor (sigma-70 family)